MVAQPQPPRRGAGRGSDRLRAWRRNSRDDGIIGSATGSGALVEPRPPEPPQTPTLEPLHPPLPEPQTPLPLPPLAPPRPLFPDEDDDDDFAPTLPQIPSIPRLPTVPPAARRLAVAADFAAYICTRNYLHGPRLRGLTTEQRMRLFSMVGRVYLPALQIAGRMPDVDAACGDDAGYAGYGDDDDE